MCDNVMRGQVIRGLLTPRLPQAGDVAEMAVRFTRLQQQLDQRTEHLTRVKSMADENLARYSQPEATKESYTTLKSQQSMYNNNNLSLGH